MLAGPSPSRTTRMPGYATGRGKDMQPGDRKHSLSRRKMLKRIGAGAAIAWTTPILSSVHTPAFAQASPHCGLYDCHNAPPVIGCCPDRVTGFLVQLETGGCECTPELFANAVDCTECPTDPPTGCAPMG